VDDLTRAKEAKKRFIKYQAQQEILSIAPYYKQVNALRENGPTDPLFAQIDTVRAKSNELLDRVGRNGRARFTGCFGRDGYRHHVELSS
jgi:hypothetical protein